MQTKRKHENEGCLRDPRRLAFVGGFCKIVMINSRKNFPGSVVIVSFFKLSSSVFAGLLTSACVIADGSEAVSRDQPVSSGATEQKVKVPHSEQKSKKKKQKKEKKIYVEGCGRKDTSGPWIEVEAPMWNDNFDSSCILPRCRDGWVIVKQVVPARIVKQIECAMEL
jgi:hypothetical protein